MGPQLVLVFCRVLTFPSLAMELVPRRPREDGSHTSLSLIKALSGPALGHRESCLMGVASGNVGEPEA